MRILLPVINLTQAKALMPLAKALLNTQSEQIVLAGMVDVDSDHPLSVGSHRAQRRRQNIHELVEMHPELSFEIEPRIRVSHNLLDELLILVKEYKCDSVLLKISYDGQQALNMALDHVLSQLPCFAILQRGKLSQPPQRILLASRGKRRSALASNIARVLRETFDAELSFLSATSDPPDQSQIEQHGQLQIDLYHSSPFSHEIIITGSLVELIENIQREMKKHQLLILGSKARAATGGVLSLRTRAILDAVKGPTIVAHVPIELRKTVFEPKAMPLSLRVDKWFAENTFDADEFSDLERLVALKQAQNLTISLGLPALNEEKTVGKVITTIREALMHSVPLLDEIVIIDSMSTDRTVDIASSLGIPVYQHPHILPELGSYPGKGEALWKSLYILRGDIIAWIDTDIANIHPRFVYGLLGPLLTSQAVNYVKGFYRRPLRVGDKIQAGGGGRVTELVARPFLNLFFPELSGIVQPLSGEYAGRRRILERLPFFNSYAVETGLLIDIVSHFGLSSIAQVDLKERIHHNQQLVALSKMSYMIIQALFDRLDEHQIISLNSEPSRSMKLIGDDEGRLFLDIEKIHNIERPPMATISTYRERRRDVSREWEIDRENEPVKYDS